MKKLSILITTLLVASLGLVGCGTSTSKTATSKNLLETIKSEGKIQIGTEGTYAPYTFHDKSGKLTGFDVEIATEVSKRLGVKPEFVETKWDGMLAGLGAKRFDMIANEVGINSDRKLKYDFSTSYIVSKAVLIVNSSDNTIKKFADLKGKKSAQSLTSDLGKIAKANGAVLQAVDGFNQSIDLLVSKRVDATVNDSLSYLDLKKQKPNLAIKIVDQKGNAQPSGFMFNKGNKELVTAVNKALADMKSDGTYSKISNKYFGSDVSK
ncbi:amino acid ABC transporter substrate-binding protein [Clostridium estertheticum]|uniref:Amino acid ABC transporter substrate-binding protein n=1 Tax=Clostridium estertheticum TaxID=238834 RepID=A0A7Y3SXH3_9CLOT|nr:amino acid ABC transporter substrate-binding protein [Clostridium estertheticum]MBX4260042.1 amino acid ABC transporter substrate-binding protein [Clostridium estertheticum]NNU77195.1 amino acid ABC transporter substrate-binding protein [Clostridium estertheticum]WBL45636.1 amino acid ABC transporter substrate-binding protein [Clostridium estertheticum]WLC72060.1 amino acid ABC transporter substrate-binding protein [Clostridium estertheticum]